MSAVPCPVCGGAILDEDPAHARTRCPHCDAPTDQPSASDVPSTGLVLWLGTGLACTSGCSLPDEPVETLAR